MCKTISHISSKNCHIPLRSGYILQHGVFTVNSIYQRDCGLSLALIPTDCKLE